jgi:hypothetical protein
MKLYRRTNDDAHWFAFGSEIGWVMFPAEVAGWQKRQRAPSTDPSEMWEVPLHMAFNTGIPGAPMSAGGASDLQRNRKKSEVVCKRLANPC